MNQWRKGIASWRCGDTLYLSVPFTWLLNDAERMAKAHKGRVLVGGPAAQLLREEIVWAEVGGATTFDALAYHNPAACFFSRGCPNRCAFCIVPQVEGDWREAWPKRIGPVVCDNNLLEATRSYFGRIIDALAEAAFPCVDFNQGLDAARFRSWHAGELARLPSVKIRFAFDALCDEAFVSDAIQKARAAGLRDISVYALLGFRDTPEEALYRLRRIVEWGATPCPMRFQPLNAKEKNAYVAPGWTDFELRKMTRYFWKYRFYSATPYEDWTAEGPLLVETERSDRC
jgi:hypothetical protein